jgi:hypothetical protein
MNKFMRRFCIATSVFHLGTHPKSHSKIVLNCLYVIYYIVCNVNYFFNKKALDLSRAPECSVSIDTSFKSLGTT